MSEVRLVDFKVLNYTCNRLDFVMGRTTSLSKSAPVMSRIRSDTPIWKLALSQSCSQRIKEGRKRVKCLIKIGVVE